MPGVEATLAEAEPTQTIWEALDGWSATLPEWQRYIVRSATAYGRLDAPRLEIAYRLFLEDRGLIEADPSAVADDAVTTSRPTEVLSERMVLTRVDGLEGVNALPSGSGLTFSPGLTIVYGRNGAGKSGFARLFANACFSRHKPAILGDIYADEPPPSVAANFHLTIGDAEQEPLEYRDGGEGHPPLRRMTVFDTAVARHHLTQAAAFEFKPAGFDVFPEMVRTFGLISERLDGDIERRTRVNEFPTAFLGGATDVHSAVSTLGPSTDLAALRKLGAYGPAESARITELDGQILALKSRSPKEALAALKEAKSDLDTLSAQLKQLQVHFDTVAIKERARLIAEARAAATTATTLGSDQFRRSFFSAVGSAEWEAFVGSVHALAHKERDGYPTHEDHCLLCERPLDQPSSDHIKALLSFAEGDARKAAAAAQTAVAAEVTKLRAVDVNVFADTSRVRSHVQKLAPDVGTQLIAVRAALAVAKDAALAALEHLTDGELATDLTAALAAIAGLLERIGADAERLEADDAEAALAAVELERKVLRHRHVLSQQLPAIEAFVADAAWVAKASNAKARLGTRFITDKEKELFGRIVGEGYRTRFAAECDRLDCDLPVELQTVGRSGQTVRSLAMRGGHKPDAILSEGEQRVVALADFLTEVSLNPASAGVIFDDPVTSQDHHRRERIAERLTAESATRQVIVFTHDLVFLNKLFEAAADAGIAVQSHWIDRDADGRPGHISLDDAPATIRVHETTKRAEAALVRARAASGSERDDFIRKGMGALRRTLEETVVRKLFKDAVPRWSDQVRVTTLRQVNWDNEKVEEICALYEMLSRHIEGHSHTDEASGAPPRLEDLEAKIAEVQLLIKWAKAHRQK